MDRPSCIQGTVEHAFEQHVELKWKDTLNMAAAESGGLLIDEQLEETYILCTHDSDSDEGIKFPPHHAIKSLIPSKLMIGCSTSAIYLLLRALIAPIHYLLNGMEAFYNDFDLCTDAFGPGTRGDQWGTSRPVVCPLISPPLFLETGIIHIVAI
jgi:hypothetical protein